jgi:hypothetical protein
MGIPRKQVTEGCDSEQIWGQMEVAEAQLGKLGIAKCVKSLSGERTAPYLAGSAWRCVPLLSSFAIGEIEIRAPYFGSYTPRVM